MEDTMENGKIIELEQEAITVMNSLASSELKREKADEWFLGLENKWGSKFIENLPQVNLDLANLIDAIGLACTPNENNDWLYTKDDFKQWLDDYVEGTHNK